MTFKKLFKNLNKKKLRKMSLVRNKDAQKKYIALNKFLIVVTFDGEEIIMRKKLKT